MRTSEKQEEGVSEIILIKRDHVGGGGDLLCCIIFQFLDYFTGVDLFVRIVRPEDCSRTALSVV